MSKIYVFIFFVFVLGLIQWDRSYIRSEQKIVIIDTEYQEEKFNHAEQLLDSMMINLDNVKSYTKVDTVFISIPVNGKSTKKNTKIEKVEEYNVEVKEMLMVQHPDSQRAIDEYENRIYFLQLELQRLRYYIDSLESKNN
jgi:hypothetical protein